jgi:hypothetical protein
VRIQSKRIAVLDCDKGIIVSFINCKIIAIGADSEEYHKSKASVPRGDKAFRISPSSLKNFMSCESRWFNGYDSPGSKATEFGSVVDTMLLTPSLVAERIAVHPDKFKEEVLKCPACGSISSGKKCRECKVDRDAEIVETDWSSTKKSCREWREQQGEKLILSTSDFSLREKAVKRMLDDEIIASFLEACQKQVLIRGEWRDKKTDITFPVECLIDLFAMESSAFYRTLGDCKCVRNANKFKFARQCFDFGWHIQAAFDLDLAIAATGRDLTHWTFIGVENYEPFEPYRRIMSETFLNIGRQTYRQGLANYAQCLKTGVWRGYDDDKKTKEETGGWGVVEATPYMEFNALEESLENAQSETLEELEPDELPMP